MKFILIIAVFLIGCEGKVPLPNSDEIASVYLKIHYKQAEIENWSAEFKDKVAQEEKEIGSKLVVAMSDCISKYKVSSGQKYTVLSVFYGAHSNLVNNKGFMSGEEYPKESQEVALKIIRECAPSFFLAKS